VPLIKYYSGDQIKDEVGGACGTCGAKERDIGNEKCFMKGWEEFYWPQENLTACEAVFCVI
jgi:hypothetical protein